MARETITVQEGQSVFDVVLQKYGDLESTFNFLALNNDLTINSELNALQEVIVDVDGLGNEDVKGSYRRAAFITNNKDDNFTPLEPGKIFQDGNGVLFQDGNLFDFN
jgi:hypothetical protein